MHWSLAFILCLVLAAAAGVWFQKAYPGMIPVIG